MSKKKASDVEKPSSDWMVVAGLCLLVLMLFLLMIGYRAGFYDLSWGRSINTSNGDIWAEANGSIEDLLNDSSEFLIKWDDLSGNDAFLKRVYVQPPIPPGCDDQPFITYRSNTSNYSEYACSSGEGMAFCAEGKCVRIRDLIALEIKFND